MNDAIPSSARSSARNRLRQTQAVPQIVAAGLGHAGHLDALPERGGGNDSRRVVPQLSRAGDTHYVWLTDDSDILQGGKLPIRNVN